MTANDAQTTRKLAGMPTLAGVARLVHRPRSLVGCAAARRGGGEAGCWAGWATGPWATAFLAQGTAGRNLSGLGVDRLGGALLQKVVLVVLVLGELCAVLRLQEATVAQRKLAATSAAVSSSLLRRSPWSVCQLRCSRRPETVTRSPRRSDWATWRPRSPQATTST